MSNLDERKTLIGVLASHDSAEKNNALVRLLDDLHEEDSELLGKFHFVFTGGTYDRILLGERGPDVEEIKPVKEATREFLKNNSTVLPSRKNGGVTVLSFAVVQRCCSILWSFLSPITAHWLNPENLALMRLSDQWHVKRLMNTGSVKEWFEKEAESDKSRNLHKLPLKLKFPSTEDSVLSTPHSDSPNRIALPTVINDSTKVEDMTIALIAHDQMKTRMVDFALDYEKELVRFNRILTTGTTGREIGDAANKLFKSNKIYRYHSGPKGGDIEIATEILFGRCHVVVFFIDPLNPHPHIEDIRVVFGACMIQDEVRMLTNEMQAREWIERVVRR